MVKGYHSFGYQLVKGLWMVTWHYIVAPACSLVKFFTNTVHQLPILICKKNNTWSIWAQQFLYEYTYYLPSFFLLKAMTQETYSYSPQQWLITCNHLPFQWTMAINANLYGTKFHRTLQYLNLNNPHPLPPIPPSWIPTPHC